MRTLRGVMGGDLAVLEQQERREGRERRHLVVRLSRRSQHVLAIALGGSPALGVTLKEIPHDVIGRQVLRRLSQDF